MSGEHAHLTVHRRLFEHQTQAPRFGQHPIQVTTGIDNGGIHRLVAPDERTVLLKRRDRNGLVLKHGEISIGFKLVTLQVNANTQTSQMRIVRVLSFKDPCTPHFFAAKSPKPSKLLG